MAHQENHQYVKIVNNTPYDVVFVSNFQSGSNETTNSLRPGEWLAFYGVAIRCIGVHMVGENTSGGHYPSSACVDSDASVLVSINPSGIAIRPVAPNPGPPMGGAARGADMPSALGATASSGQEGQTWPPGVGFRCLVSGSINQGQLNLACEAQGAGGRTPGFPNADRAFCTPGSRGLECRFLQ